MLVAFTEFVDPNPSPGNQFGGQVVPLSTGNVVVTSPYDDAGGTNAGAVYLFNGSTGALISTLRGSHANDQVGERITVLANGNYVISSPSWDNGLAADAGAVTLGNGVTGVSGVVSAANSLVGGKTNDLIGGGPSVTALRNGNYVVGSRFWDNGLSTDAGAVTWGSGLVGAKGVVSSANSLVGATANDQVGEVIELANGNYVVSSRFWDNGTNVDAGAVTWANGTAGIIGTVGAANSLVGSKSGDRVGNVTGLTNGNYVVFSKYWDNGAITDVGAVTWGRGSTGVKGAVSSANSLIGSAAGDQVSNLGVTSLGNDNYVVISSLWDNGAVANAGAVTWGSGTTGIVGSVSAANSLVGSSANDQIGAYGGTVLTNGNYVVRSPLWDNGAATDAGAVTWGSGTAGVKGVVSAANSLVGTKASDSVGDGNVTALANGNYVVGSGHWDNGAVIDTGAVTWGSGTAGIKGAVSSANSLVGSSANDQVSQVTALSFGHYVVNSPNWDNGAVVDAGAVTWGSGVSGAKGVISTANSLVGSTKNDNVGWKVTPLTNGSYVVNSPNWDYGSSVDAGAVTWGFAIGGIIGTVSATNSLVSNASKNDGGVIALRNGNFVVNSPSWNNGTALQAGAVTWGSGVTGIAGVVSAANSFVGSRTND